MDYIILLPTVVAILLGGAVSFIKFTDTEKLNKYSVVSTCIISVLSFAVLYFFNGSQITVFSFNEILKISFKIDGLSIIFAAMVSFLWPLAVMYATEYMKHEGKQIKFFTFYIMTFGITLMLAFSANMLTMYLAYELLTFITLPLVMHAMDNRSKYATNKYLIYSVGGASLSFMGMMLAVHSTGTLDFVYGGVVNAAPNNMVLIAYLLMFAGFGVKSAIFPLHGWLPAAGVAPTTVTALLHAVAVVKAGVFALMRTVFYLFGATTLAGTYAQNITMIVAIVTICYGSAMAMRSKHLKRRLAYSTVSQLSYIVLGISIMTPAGYMGALAHMIFHAFMKIVLFYTAGNVLYTSHKEYVSDIEGYGKKMPISFICFTICSLALIGVPPLGGFFSKFAIATAAASLQNALGFWDIAALMLSALLTAMYLLQIIVLAYIPHKDFDYSRLDKAKEAPKAMTTPLVIITFTMIVMSLASKPLFDFLQFVAQGGI